MENQQILNKDDVMKIKGEIYKITNTTNGKCYIGQTRSHRLNHNKYRPFGYLGRFKDHIHEANSSKKNQCRYLNSSIVKYGSECFTCELIHTCSLDELDIQEQQFIIQYNSKYPNGYNLTNGGKGFTDINSGDFVWEIKPISTTKEKSKSLLKSDYTKKLISDRLKVALNDETHRVKRMKLTQNQHLTKKYEVFKNVSIDDDIDKYIHIIKNNKNNTEYISIAIDKRKTTFVGKYEPIDSIIERAKNFILDLKEWQHCQIAGNS
jgi:hypothetical protein